MAPPTNEERLAWPERLKVVSVSFGFVVLSCLFMWLFWGIGSVWDSDWIGEDFWEPVGVGPYRIRKGFAHLLTVGCYLVLLPAACVVFVVGVVHGLRGRRTRLASWILREMSQQDVRKRHEKMLASRDADGELSRSDNFLESYLPPVVGWAVLFGFLAAGLAVLAWAVTRE